MESGFFFGVVSCAGVAAAEESGFFFGMVSCAASGRVTTRCSVAVLTPAACASRTPLTALSIAQYAQPAPRGSFAFTPTGDVYVGIFGGRFAS